MARPTRIADYANMRDVYLDSVTGRMVYINDEQNYNSKQENPTMPSREEVMREQLVQARAAIAELTENLERFAAPPHGYANVVAVKDKTVTITGGGSFIDVARPSFLLAIGDTVLVNQQTQTIIEPVDPVGMGRIVPVSNVLSEREAEIAGDGSPKLVLIAPGAGMPTAGDRAVLDASGNVIVRVLKMEKQANDYTRDTGVNWESIGGQERAKRELREAVELPLLRPEVFKHYGKKPSKGVMLYGPPGCGKTLLGKACATAIAKAAGVDGGGCFIYVKGPEILNMYVGASEASVRELFHRARTHVRETGYQAVIFIDEADAIMSRRGGPNSFMEKTIVPAFLTEMDGMEESGVLVILATNRPDTLDSAITRDGRIDRKVRVSRPNAEDARLIFDLYLKGVPVADGEDREAMATAAVDALFCDSRAFWNLQTQGGGTHRFTLANLVSGALIAGIVSQAVSEAMHRDLAGTGAPEGVRTDDLLTAVARVYEQNRDVDHRDAMAELELDGIQITGAERAKAA